MMVQPIGELEFKILSKTGELERMFKKPMDSFLRNFPLWFWYSWIGANAVLYDVAGTLRNLVLSPTLRADAPDANNAYGILVGTGTNPVSTLDNNLQTKIAHGIAAGQLYHKITTLTGFTQSAPETHFNISRNFDNNSGNTITVNEAGLILYNPAGVWFFLFARDLTGAIDVLNTKTLVTQYTFKVTA